MDRPVRFPSGRLGKGAKMSRRKCRILLLLAAAVLLILAAWWAFCAPHTYFRLYDRRNQEVVLEVAAAPGDQFRLEIEHSFEHIPWYEYYTVTDDLAFNLDAIAVAGYGAGIPAEMDVPTHIEDGLIWMEDINSRFEELKWLTSSTYMKVLTLNGEEIFDFRSLPDASLIRGEIITKRGFFSIGQGKE